MKTETWTLVEEPIPAQLAAEVGILIDTSDTEADILRLVLDYAGRFGATNVLAGMVPSAGQTRRQQTSHVLLNAWPTCWVLRYFSNDYLRHDPTIAMVREHHLPFLWSEIGARRLKSEEARAIMGEASDAGLKQGLTIAFPTVEGGVIGFSVAGERIEIGELERNSMRVVANLAMRRALHLHRLSQMPFPKGITPREREALQLAADGWKDQEIAIRMGISHHGAEKHLRSVRDKLEAKNTAHALAMGMRLGVIR